MGIEDALSPRLRGSRLALVFGFGLLHGLGFAGVLGQLGLPEGRRVAALLSFNAGVEIGQLVVIGLVLLFLRLWAALGGRPEAPVRPLSLCLAVSASSGPCSASSASITPGQPRIHASPGGQKPMTPRPFAGAPVVAAWLAASLDRGGVRSRSRLAGLARAPARRHVRGEGPRLDLVEDRREPGVEGRAEPGGRSPRARRRSCSTAAPA